LAYPLIRWPLALLILAALVGSGLHLHDTLGRQVSFVLMAGAAFGFVLQRSRFCFFCILREWIEEGDPRGMLGILAALAVGTLGYLVLFGAWVPDPTAGHLPPRAHIGPVSWLIVLGGLCFGVGMSLSGSCISAHLYRLGEGNWLSLFALAGVLPGFILGFMLWTQAWPGTLAEAPVEWLPARFGYAGSAALQLVILALVTLWLFRHFKQAHPPVQSAFSGRPADLVDRIFRQRWPAWLGGAFVGLIGVALYLRAQPLGVTAEISHHARQLGQTAGLLPERIVGLDRVAGCIISDAVRLIGDNGVFIIAMVAASTAAALMAGQFKPARRPWRSIPLAIIGGLLLGFGSMIALGCSIGTLLSGISALALSGWLFALSMVAGVCISLPLRRRLS